MRTDSRRRAPRAVADTERGTILASAEVAASPERVFRALTTPSEIEEWWGSADAYRMREWTQALRVSGRWSVVVCGADGSKHPANGEFLKIDAPHELVITRRYDFDFPQLGRRATTVAYRMEPVADGTRVTVRHDGFAGCPDAAHMHADGWERFLGWLDAYVSPNAGEFQ